MQRVYGEANINVTMADGRFRVLNLIYERFERSIPSHSHGSGSYEIHYIPAGYGRAVIEGRDYPIAPNTLYLTGPHVVHAQAPQPEEPMCEYCIYLQLEKRRTTREMPEAERELLLCFERTPFWFGQDGQQAGELVTTLFRAVEERRQGWILEAEALLQQILVRLVRCFAAEEPGGKQPTVQRMNKTAVVIEDYFLYEYQHLLLPELAKKLSLSVRQTERLLQRYYGKTFLQMKTEARMSAAVTLLTETEQSISAIAEALGYSSIEHFSAAFKRYYQQSPHQYRKTYCD